jgi:release factor glutamine methyltransferase
LNAAATLAAAGIDPREARLLLAAACGVSTANVVAHPERELAPQEAERFADHAARRRAGEPIAYILGRREFYGLTLAVSPAVLIPRPETELLVDQALRLQPNAVLDLGTGCGAVALAIKRARPAARIVAVDASPAALEVARRNAAMLGLEVEFREGLWFEPVAGERFDLVVANPPYVAQGDPHLGEGDLRFEPAQALVSGPDGLEAIRCIGAHAAAHLLPRGWLLLEHGLGQEVAVKHLLAAHGFESLTTWLDLAGIARATGGRLKSE